MSLVFDYGFEKSYATTTNITSSNAKIVNQLNSLDSALKDYDISRERIYAFRERASNLSKLEYMNMKYLASCLVIMSKFEEEEHESPYEELLEYLKELFESENFEKIYYEKMVNISNEESKTYYKVYLKRVVVDYCFKLVA